MTTCPALSRDYRKALSAVRDLRTTSMVLWGVWVKLLLAQYNMPGHSITAAQLAEAAGLSSDRVARSRYDDLAQRIAEQLSFTPENDPANHKPLWWTTIAHGADEQQSSPHFQFVMNAELAEAIRLMGWVKPVIAAADGAAAS